MICNLRPLAVSPCPGPPKATAPPAIRGRHQATPAGTYYVDLDADEITEGLYRVSGQAGTVFSTVAPAVEG